jgi:hypothetical protein
MAIIAAAAIGAAASIYASQQSSRASSQASQAQSEAAALQTQVARELHDHWKAYYQPCDVAAIQEVCAEPVFVPRYAETAGRTRMEILRSFARARDQARRCADTYCVGAVAQQCNFISGIEAIALTDAVNFGYRWEENYAYQRNQVRLQRKYDWLGLGRNLLNQSSAASSLASQIANRLGALSGATANGWLQTAGYLLSERGQTALSGIAGRLGRLFGGPAPTGQESMADIYGGPAQFATASSNMPGGVSQNAGGATGGDIDPGSYAAPNPVTGNDWTSNSIDSSQQNFDT